MASLGHSPRPRAEVLRQFLSFGVVGTIGFVVDAGVLTLVLATTGLGFYWGRLISFLAAATVTWALNRRFTFGGAEKRGRLGQWARFVLVNSGGGLVNYAVYAALIAASAFARNWPVLAVAAGSIAGLLVNFTASKWLVFKPARGGTAGR